MNDVKHNIENEKKLVDLLGCKITDANGSNRWTILDKDNNKVGYIQYRKIYGGNKKKGYAKIYGYHTVINSPTFAYDTKRLANDIKGNIIEEEDCSYSIDIKNENGNLDRVEICTGSLPSLFYNSEKHGCMTFKIDFDGMHVSFDSETENYYISEVLNYRNLDEHPNQNEYTYFIKHSRKDPQTGKKGVETLREISGTQSNDDGIIVISEQKWIAGEMKVNQKCYVESNVEEMALKHKMGMDCFSHFRFLINQILPFNREIISFIVSSDIVRENNLSMFLTNE